MVGGETAIEGGEVRRGPIRSCAVSAGALLALAACGGGSDEESTPVDTTSVETEQENEFRTAPVEAVQRVDANTVRITLTTCDAGPEIASWSVDADAMEVTVLVSTTREGGLGDCLDSVEQAFSETGTWTLIDERDGSRYEIEPL